MRKPKSALLQRLRKALHLAILSNKIEAPSSSELLELYRQKMLTRRKFLQQSAAAGMIIGTSSLLPLSGCRKDTALNKDAKIVIIGAGIAGLSAAYHLQKAGFATTIYEGSNRIGGRMYSAQGLMGSGITTELGGEFIDSIHEDLLAYAAEFGLELLDTWDESEALLTEAYFFDGQHYSVEDVINAFAQIAPQMEADYNALPELIDYNHTEAAAIDNTSIAQYLDQIGADGFLKKLLDVAYVTEYGLESSEQTCLNLLYLISTDTSEGFDIFGESDERYKIAGGNQRIVDEIVARLSADIITEHKLISLNNSDEKIMMTYDNSGTTVDVQADIVIVAIPFSTLRDADLAGAFPLVKINAIQHLGYGTNAKLFLGYNDRIWRNQGYNGEVFTDLAVQLAWDHSQLQNNNNGPGALTVYTGGIEGINIGLGSPEGIAPYYVTMLNQIFPGTSAVFNNTVSRFHWPSHIWTKGSYACYKPGQITTFGGAEIEEAGHLFFAGEHCSTDFQGYMNGGAETGRRAAEKIVSLLS